MEIPMSTHQLVYRPLCRPEMPVCRFLPSQDVLRTMSGSHPGGFCQCFCMSFFRQSQFQNRLGDINHRSVHRPAVHVGSVFRLRGTNHPVRKPFGRFQILLVSESFETVREHACRGCRVLDSPGIIQGLRPVRPVKQIHDMFETHIDSLIKAVIRKISGSEKAGMESVPAFDMGGGFLACGQDVFTGLSHGPFPRRMYARDGRSRPASGRDFYRIKPGAAKFQ